MKRYLISFLLTLTILLSNFSLSAESRKETLRFAVSFNSLSSTIRPGLSNNAAILDSLVRYINTQHGRKGNIQLRIKGSSSSEGDAVVNKELARRRAEALKTYLQKNVTVNNLHIALDKSEVDWQMLRGMVAASSMKKRNKILHIIDCVPEYVFKKGVIVDGRKAQLMNVDYGRAWRYMEENFFPKMRYAAATCLVDFISDDKSSSKIENGISGITKSGNRVDSGIKNKLSDEDIVVVDGVKTAMPLAIKLTGSNYEAAVDKVEKLAQENVNDQMIIEFTLTESDFKVTPEERAMIMKMRAEKLKEKIEKNSKINLTVVVDENAIDWNGLKQLIEKSKLSNKGEILDIIKSGAEYVTCNGELTDARKIKLMSLAGGEAWKQLEKDYMPKLQKVCSVYAFTNQPKTLSGMEVDGMKLKEVITSVAPMIKIAANNHKSALERVNKLQHRGVSKVELMRFAIDGSAMKGTDAEIKGQMRREAEALVASIQRSGDCSNLMVVIDDDAIDFVQLRRMVEVSTLANRDEILAIIDKKPEYLVRNGKLIDSRKTELMNLASGQTWSYLQKNFLPALPKLCTVNVIAIPQEGNVAAPVSINEITTTVASAKVENIKGENYSAAVAKVAEMRNSGKTADKGELQRFVIDASDIKGTPTERRAAVEHRAKALRQELERSAAGSNLMVVVDEEGIDFDAVRKQVEKMNIPNKQEILKILSSKPEYKIENEKVVDSRLAQLQAVGGGAAWKQIEEKILPNLPKVCSVNVVSVPNLSSKVSNRPIEITDKTPVALNPEVKVSNGNFKNVAEKVANMRARKSSQVELTRFAIDESELKGTPAERRAAVKQRAEALRAELAKTTAGSNLMVVVDEDAIDFEQLRKQVEKSNIPNKKEILKILSRKPEYRIIDGKAVDIRQIELQALKNGAVWKQIEEKILPSVPKTCVVNVVSVPEDPEEKLNRLTQIAGADQPAMKVTDKNIAFAIESVKKQQKRNSRKPEALQFLIEDTNTEGLTPEERRERLAMRAEALRDSLQAGANGASMSVVIEEESIDWGALRKMVEKSNMKNKKEILAIIDSRPEIMMSNGTVTDSRKTLLMSLNGGESWREIETKFLPNLPLTNTLHVVTFPDDSMKRSLMPAAVTEFIAESNYGLKTNLLTGVLMVPSVGFEYGHGHYSVALSGYFGWWSTERPFYANAMGGDLALRWWPNEAMKGHHLGIYGQAFSFDYLKDRIGQYAPPFGYAVGVEYGYSLKLSNSFRLDLTAGGGYTTGTVHQYKRYTQGDVTQKTSEWSRFLPTKAEISLVWLLSNH